ncbi:MULTISPECIES: DUF3267 domain-containing protein [Bacillus]|uniref:DUF3267 domain-containing protein n=1 Tax=Bacillus TaxID=1386 RepID=UPI000B4366E0|nr:MULTISPECIES: DUF3267 domain-containing protein [Bacillus]MBH0346394.1 hypothetical protein [Bacillus thuringiensis]MCC2338957.1 DUF3267 domain-containing protein [Bacillus tropicus]MCU5424465.1 DUF3267 domain-containing protein [Bacillus tropicus]MDA1651032.1 DUF3267 domain-containing protein [Bacillus cereus group sp. TH160LC]MDA1800774.1 DUF3267 domain-containing protein [Bacillus cereus group sp. BY6-1LC]
MDLSEWNPFIQNNWHRKHYMKFVYVLQIIIFLIPNYFGASFTDLNIFYLIIIGILVFIIHECLHIIVINNKGDISLTRSGIFFWLNTNAILSKARFWTFMSLPIIVLSVIPAIISSFVSGNIKSILLFVCWINSIISASDIYNSLLIAMKPKHSIFCRGYYKVKEN